MLEEKSGLKFFVNGVKPDWDDKETASGGIWSVPIKRGPDCKQQLEQYWVDVVCPPVTLHHLLSAYLLLRLCAHANQTGCGLDDATAAAMPDWCK